MRDGRHLVEGEWPQCSFYMHATCVSMTRDNRFSEFDQFLSAHPVILVTDQTNGGQYSATGTT